MTFLFFYGILNSVESKKTPKNQAKNIMINLQQITQLIEKNPGCVRKITYRKPLKVKKNSELVNVEKESVFYIRFVDYGNQKAVIEAKENGQKDCPNNWIRLTRGVYQDDKGNIKISCGSAPEAMNLPRSRTFFVNGVETPLDNIKTDLYANDAKSSEEAPQWFTLKQEYIKQIADIKA